MNFENKVVLITGATGGIGLEAAKEFAKRGAKLSLVDISNNNLDELKKKIKLNNDNSLFITADVSNEEQVKKYVAQTIDKFGTIDIFLNNAGVEGDVASIIETKKEDLDYVLDVNVKGAYYGLKHVLPIMYENKEGSVINTSSIAGFIGCLGMAPYVASKHALLGINKSAALESAPFNVRVNAICPGPVDNNMMRNIEIKVAPGAPDAVRDNLVKDIPLGKYAQNIDIVNMILFLASDLSTYITGIEYRIDGGMAAK
ncbi:MAG: SDR family NAD(P)-dependent oxidoreductase [Bacilli bacterium]|nr:SDR family NAD(P)-dependent oxidoreductase [Bacilli bacterium]MDD4407062.1 SDR family NAD(P)-dependent oxidoreductase [Bacilli bacterium]